MNRRRIHELRDAGVITERQAQILDYRRRGFSLRQIALGMNLSPSTVRDHEAAAARRIANHRPQEDGA